MQAGPDDRQLDGIAPAFDADGSSNLRPASRPIAFVAAGLNNVIGA